MSKVSAFSAPDTLRLLAGMDAAGVVDRKLLKTFWARVETKQAGGVCPFGLLAHLLRRRWLGWVPGGSNHRT